MGLASIFGLAVAIIFGVGIRAQDWQIPEAKTRSENSRFWTKIGEQS